MEHLIIDLVKWLIPVGGLGSVVAWLFNRTSRDIKQLRDCYELVIQMNVDLKKSLQDEIEKNKQLRQVVGKLERAANKVFRCKYYPSCPVDAELRQSKKTDARVRGQPRRDNSRQSGDRGDADNDDDAESENDDVLNI